MRMSCNGCRVLRKGCSENCEIRACIEWINSPDSQANATLFLAKFYGRAGLLNLINAGSQHLRPAIFKSLLYDACGRIVNPTYGSVGLLGSGNWVQCQAAVDAVLAGSPITGTHAGALHPNNTPLKSACDIRHVSRGDSTSQHHDLNLQVKSRNRFKRPATTACRPKMPLDSLLTELCPSPLGNGGSSSGDQEKRMFSVETVEGSSSLASRADPEALHKFNDKQADDHDEEIGLELTLGLARI